jgi:hypothetical protein
VNITNGNVFLDEVKVNFNMLYTLVLDGVGWEVDVADIVTVDESVLQQRSIELLQELSEPTCFNHAIDNDAILNLGARAGDNVLTIGGPWDEVVVEEHSIARGGPACIRPTRPIHICVDCQLRGGGGASQVETGVQGTSQIAQDYAS